ncbi:MAG: hypothetical protein ACKV22_27880 [Bryobacteraceae bacterium]
MSIDEILQLLTTERDKLNLAIGALQGLTAQKRRGRPPRNPLASASTPARPASKRRRPKLTEAQRQAQSERMRLYWANRKKQEGKARKGVKKRAKRAKPAAEASAA